MHLSLMSKARRCRKAEARNAYRDYIDRHDVAYPFGPVAIAGGPSWTAKN
jgi:hypothetical protein